jgi:DUF3102 family protein
MTTPTTQPKANAPCHRSHNPLSTLAQEIRDLHGEILAVARTSLEKAIRIGELLTQAKQSLAHGEWLPWLKACDARQVLQMRCRADLISNQFVVRSIAFHNLAVCKHLTNHVSRYFGIVLVADIT